METKPAITAPVVAGSSAWFAGPLEDLYMKFKTSSSGLTEAEAKRRLAVYGRNEPVKKEKRNIAKDIAWRFTNPLVVLLLVIGTFSLFFGDKFSAGIIYLMACLSVLLSFIQEYRAERAAEELGALVRVTAWVYRDGKLKEVNLKDIVPGDIVNLSAGNMIPADVELISCKDLFVNESSLTGESFPVEKFTLTEQPDASSRQSTQADQPSNILSQKHLAFMGSSVVSGTGKAVVLNTGANTMFGQLSRKLLALKSETAFDQGIRQFTWLMIKSILVLVAVILVINTWAKGDFWQSLLFALAVAVGLTPETLPVIVTINLSKGARDLAKKRVIVKRLDAIQNFGAMDVLCTDKTGTLTLDKVVLERYCDVDGKDDEDVLKYGYLNSFYQTGLRNLLDKAVLEHQKLHLHGYEKVDEIPFDFNRKVMSVVVKMDGYEVLITKGAPEDIFTRCSHYEHGGEVLPVKQEHLDRVAEEYDKLSTQGFRVLAVAYKNILEIKSVYSPADESNLVLKGYMAFLDPPKPTAKQTIGNLKANGVSFKVLTGDNELVTKKICSEIGLDAKAIITGEQVEKMPDGELSQCAETATVFARLMPLQKERVIRILHQNGHVVGFLGDGINDAPALKAADVGISVNNAADVAKDSASLILLKKSLMVLNDGVVEGRKVFGNILKYLRMGSSSNFGNMLSMTGASLLLPFLPMAPIQILLNNFLYDVSQMGIPTDEVDAEYLKKPRAWNIGLIKKFMLLIGPVSSLFDFATFALMWWVFLGYKNVEMFHTGWFLESLLSQTLVIYIIRTRKIPFVQSRPSRGLILSSLVVLIVGFALPFSPLARAFGFAQMPWLYFVALAVMMVLYLSLAQLAKTWFVHRYELE